MRFVFVAKRGDLRKYLHIECIACLEDPTETLIAELNDLDISDPDQICEVQRALTILETC